MDATPSAPADELIVQNGRLRGSRTALGAGLTLLGRAEGCDVRLDADEVLPVHCAIARGPGGFVLRAMPGAVTLVNGRPVDEWHLHDGDLLWVGPFQFRAGIATDLTDRAALEREKDALRIQAAAVAAQQAALTEEEARLEQRRVTLDRQESQLAAHLEARSRKLVELQEQVRSSRRALRDERNEHEKRVGQTTDELLRSRREVEAGLAKLRQERRHLSELHRRLKQRHAAHWKATEAALQQREEQVAEERHRLEADRAALTEARLRFNGEAELGRRQLQDAREAFGRARQQWEGRRGHEQAELRRRARELAEAEYGLGEQWRLWEEARQAREAEAEGLEGRIRNLRRKVHDYEQEARQRGLIPADPPLSPEYRGEGRKTRRPWPHWRRWRASWPTGGYTCWSRRHGWRGRGRSGAPLRRRRWLTWARPAGICKSAKRISSRARGRWTRPRPTCAAAPRRRRGSTTA